MEDLVRGVDPFEVHRPQGIVAIGPGDLELRALVSRHLDGGEPGASGLDLAHGLEQLDQPGRMDGRYHRTAMRAQLDQLHGGKLLQRLTDRRAGDGKALCYRHLVQALAR